MSQLSEIMSTQRSLEESFIKKMHDLEQQIQGAGPGKETVAKVAEEFRTFRELMFNMLGLLRKQINECCMQIEAIETRHRRKALILLGVAESEKEDCKEQVCGILNSKLGLKDISRNSLTVCHRLGSSSSSNTDDNHRPILIRFAQVEARTSVWRAKTGLKGTGISVREFLTKSRQAVFSKARLHFGIRSCWTQDGIIFVKSSDGKRHKVVLREELDSLIAKYPKALLTTAALSGRSGNKNNK
ncbi:unnamed protein product [Diatraea saccharalis]|uniref:Uncharacterized protein n=1 Tax=Diatraea saccharalis TaxID=40085 RepID=A0A9N9QKH7_9NEOP|nr:unnamed protein product [Diatraea saccharalis]